MAYQNEGSKTNKKFAPKVMTKFHEQSLELRCCPYDSLLTLMLIPDIMTSGVASFLALALWLETRAGLASVSPAS
jgi:hypothetical protein